MMNLQKSSGFSISDSLSLKGVVIILMVFHHLFRAPSLYENYQINFLFFKEDFINELFTYFKLCVGVFAFIPGFGLTQGYKKSRANKELCSSFTSKRALKVMLPFWFILSIAIPITQLIDNRPYNIYFKSEKNVVNGLLNLILDLLALQSFTKTPSLDSSWWYMGAALLFVFATPILIKAIEKFGGLATIISVVLLPRLLGIGFLGGTSPISFITPFLSTLTYSKNLIDSKFPFSK